MLWPCGHTAVLDLSWLPDERVRYRRAVETSLHDSCLRCEPGTTTAPVGNVRVLPVVPEQARGRPVGTRADLSQAVAGGEAWIEITSRTQPVVVDAGVPAAMRADVAYRARARVAGRGPVVTSWGMTTVSEGGRVAAASGSRTELDGGVAAVSDGGVLIARCGRAVVDAGGQVVLAQDAHHLEVWVLPWARVQAHGEFHLVLERPWGQIMSASGDRRPAGCRLPDDLERLLEASRAMGPRL